MKTREAERRAGGRETAATEGLCAAASKRSREPPLVKLSPPKPGEQRYAVAIQDGSDLWLTLWVRCWPDRIFVMLPRSDPDWDVHVSYHYDGGLHTKTLLPSRGYHDRPISRANRQPLTAVFKGIEHLANLKGHGKGTGEVCDPKSFDGVVYAEPGVLDRPGPHQGSVAVDLVEPGYKPKPEPGGPKRHLFPRGARPSVVITIYPAEDPLCWKYLEWPDDFVKVE
jgi:hypothetical protein